MRYLLFFLCLFLTNAKLAAQESLEMALFNLPDVAFKAIEAPEGFESAYELRIKQPLDHKQPEKGHFYQRVFLSHRSMDAPTVLVTEGYQRPANRIYELTEYMGANQIQVEHRYFGASLPEDPEFQYLSIEQMAADLHKANQLFRQVYNQPFVSTGISKGGMTTLFYKYFYPDDVAAAVPYVAPINLAFKDQRIYTFLDTVGTEECRNKILDFQRKMLKKKDDYLSWVQWYAKGRDISFERLGLEAAYEYAVLEYSFSFWQLGHDCGSIPGKDATDQEMVDHLLTVSNVDFFSDATIDGYASFYYQMGTELGYYAYETEDFKGLIEALEEEPSAVFMPQGLETPFDPTLTTQVHDWLVSKGDRIAYINGSADTWSATKVIPRQGVDAAVFNLPGKDHVRARIRFMSSEQEAAFEQKLEQWLDMDIPGELPGR